jgi:hypothetical protein
MFFLWQVNQPRKTKKKRTRDQQKCQSKAKVPRCIKKKDGRNTKSLAYENLLAFSKHEKPRDEDKKLSNCIVIRNARTIIIIILSLAVVPITSSGAAFSPSGNRCGVGLSTNIFRLLPDCGGAAMGVAVAVPLGPGIVVVTKIPDTHKTALTH